MLFDLKAKTVNEVAEFIIESPAHEHIKYQAESLKKRRLRETKRHKNQQTQVRIDEFIQKADKECQHVIHQMPFASQTILKLNEWWTQTYPPSTDDAQLQTDTCYREDKQIQSEMPKHHKLVQTMVKGQTRKVKKTELEMLEDMQADQVIVFAEIRAKRQSESTFYTCTQLDKAHARLEVVKSGARKKRIIKKRSVETQTDRRETASQLMQAELICLPDEEETEKIFAYSNIESAILKISKTKPTESKKSSFFSKF
jgi:hypothetical protein